METNNPSAASEIIYSHQQQSFEKPGYGNKRRREQIVRSPEKKSAKRSVLTDINVNAANESNFIYSKQTHCKCHNETLKQRSNSNDDVRIERLQILEKEEAENEENVCISAFEEISFLEDDKRREKKFLKIVECNSKDYATEIFNYMKFREKHFRIDDYMPRQISITKTMRSLLVDWMVEVQQIFNLHHETLYLAVKITDIYLSRKIIPKEILQLIGVATLLLSSKYDERKPLFIADFLYICNYAYTKKDIIRKEMDVFRVIGCNLCIPLSYRFLQRYGKCCGTPTFTFTLARYILELSLSEYNFIVELESKLASAALYLALKMTDLGSWTPKLEYYSGYKIFEFANIAVQFNVMLHKKPNERMKAIRTKYSRRHFFDITRVPLIDEFYI